MPQTARWLAEAGSTEPSTAVAAGWHWHFASVLVVVACVFRCNLSFCEFRETTIYETVVKFNLTGPNFKSRTPTCRVKPQVTAARTLAKCQCHPPAASCASKTFPCQIHPDSFWPSTLTTDPNQPSITWVTLKIGSYEKLR